ncbi:MAG: hypothetical protein ABW104_04810 [Candidatus Thiodiazotropha sp. 6PLUC2]
MTSTNKTQQNFDDAQKFLQDCLTTPTLAQGYETQGQIAQQKSNPDLLTSWLKSKGYDTNPTQIVQAQEQQQSYQLSYWSGTYGKTSVKKSDGTFVVGPPIVVVDNSTVLINNVAIVNFQFENATLSWTSDANDTAGSIVFQEIPSVNSNENPPTGYTGKLFSGSLTQTTCTPGNGALTYSGQIGDIVSFPLENWSGNYGATSLKQADGSYLSGPPLIVKDAATVLLDETEIKNFTYCSVGNSLSWSLDDNATAGSVTFSKIVTPTSTGYVGPTFYGTLQNNSSSPAQQYSGTLSTPEKLSDWIGVYGQTTITKSDGSYEAGPPVVVISDTQVTLSGRNLTDIDFDINTNVLTWPFNSNQSGGSITFMRITTPTSSGYVGNSFSGTIQQESGGGTLPFSGILGQPYSGGGGYHETTLQKIFTIAGYVIVVIAGLQYIYQGIKLAKWAWTKFSQWRQSAEEVDPGLEDGVPEADANPGPQIDPDNPPPENTTTDTTTETQADPVTTTDTTTDVTTEVTDVTTEVTDVTTEVTDVTTEVTDVTTEVTDVTTEVTEVEVVEVEVVEVIVAAEDEEEEDPNKK